MTRISFLVASVGIVSLIGCSGSGGGGNASVSGEALYMERHPDGNTFACATCHSI